MNDNWLEIIEILTPVFKTSDKLASRKAMESCLRMLGWKTINKSMVVDFKTASGANIDIALGNEEAGGYHVALPILVTTEAEEKFIADKIKSAASEVGCRNVITLGHTLNLYFKPDEEDEYICIKKICIAQEDIYGFKLANILPSSDFDEEQVNSFFKTIYDDVALNIKLESVLDEIIKNKDKAKEVLKTYLELEGFEGKYVDDKLDEILVDIYYQGNIVSEPALQLVTTYTSPLKEGGQDRTKFSINGGEMLSKKRFVHAVVSLYIKEHPSVTLDDLEKQFPSNLISKERGVIRPYELIKDWAKETKGDIMSRYCTKPDEIIRLQDGTEVVVNSQWGKNNFPRFLAVAQSLYNIASSKPYCSVTNIQSMNLEKSGHRASNFKFSMAGINDGEYVTFDPINISVKVASENEVIYEGKKYRLSSFVKAFIPDHLRTPSDSYRGPDFFSYNGKILTELRNAQSQELADESESNVQTPEGTNRGIHISEQALTSFKSRK